MKLFSTGCSSSEACIWISVGHWPCRSSPQVVHGEEVWVWSFVGPLCDIFSHLMHNSILQMDDPTQSERELSQVESTTPCVWTPCDIWLTTSHVEKRFVQEMRRLVPPAKCTKGTQTLSFDRTTVSHALLYPHMISRSQQPGCKVLSDYGF